MRSTNHNPKNNEKEPLASVSATKKITKPSHTTKRIERLDENPNLSFLSEQSIIWSTRSKAKRNPID